MRWSNVRNLNEYTVYYFALSIALFPMKQIFLIYITGICPYAVLTLQINPESHSGNIIGRACHSHLQSPIFPGWVDFTECECI